MGLSYTADVFFGAFVSRHTLLGGRLDKYVEKHGGTTAPTEIPGVGIDMVGSQSSGEIWMVVKATGSGQSFSREDEIQAPRLLTEDPAWRPAVESLFARMKVKDAPAIGWHFAGSVT